MHRNNSDPISRIKVWPLIFLAIMLFSCRHASKPPADLIPTSTMEKILLDVNLAESYSLIAKDSLHRAGTKNTDSLTLYYKSIFAHYKVSGDQFATSLNWYKGNPELLDTMYNNIIPVVTAMQTKPAAPLPPPSNVMVTPK